MSEAQVQTFDCGDCGATDMDRAAWSAHCDTCTVVEPCSHCGTAFEDKGASRLHVNYRYRQCMASPEGEGHEVTGGKAGNCYYKWSCTCGASWSEDSSG